jgi:hypothetical protein
LTECSIEFEVTRQKRAKVVDTAAAWILEGAPNAPQLH